MHYYALVEIPHDATDIEKAVASAMEPYNENGPDGEYVESGIWDWYQIGGRWTGELGDYDPLADRRNMRVCFLCAGTGRREDDLGRRHRALVPEYGCNGCDSTGIEYKHTSEWVTCEQDVSLRRDISDEHKPYTLITLDGSLHMKKRWNGTDFEDMSAEHEAAWHELDPDARLVVVDYHC